jgi:hypothetical protein
VTNDPIAPAAIGNVGELIHMLFSHFHAQALRGFVHSSEISQVIAFLNLKKIGEINGLGCFIATDGI